MRERFFSVMTISVCLCLAGCGEASPARNPTVSDESDKSGFMANTPEDNAQEVVEQLTSTPEGRATADRLASKDDQLTAFQRANEVPDSIAEAAINKWVIEHGGNFDWDLEEVKAICHSIKRQ